MADRDRQTVRTALAALVLVVGVAAGAAVAAAGPNTCRKQMLDCDRVAPTVMIVQPGQGATVAGVVAVSGFASDNVGVRKVTVAVDSQAPVKANGISPWTATFDMGGFASGSHSITAAAHDASGNVGKATISVVVQPVPGPSPSTSPSAAPSPSLSPSPSVSPSPSLSPTPSVSPSPSVAPSPTTSPTPSGSPSPSGSPAPSPPGSPTTFPSPTGTPDSDPGWLVPCDYSHSLTDDPIVFPGKAGASHWHDFIGNESVFAGSTYQGMVAAATNCSPESGDTAGYWAPMLFRNGVQVVPHGPPPNGTDASYHARQQVYYRDNLDPNIVVHAPPPGLMMITGNSKATSLADNPYLGREIYWGCSNNTPDEKFTAPVDCTTGIITLHIGFQNCWDGVNLDTLRPDGTPAVNPITGVTYPNDHRSHVAYPIDGPSGTYVCPADHPVAIPRIIVRMEYPVGTDSSGITLASGPTYTVHGDFWNTWNQDRLEQLVSVCTNGRLDCGTL